MARAQEAELPAMLLQAIAAAPADDAPRLVAADWFAEHGSPDRAELIALQCQLEKLDPASPEREPLEQRARALARGAPPGLGPELAHLTFGLVRGFPGAVEGEPGDVAAAAQRLAELPLPIERLALSRLGDRRALERLMRTPFWAGIRTLQLDRLDDAAATVLFESGKMEALEHLVIEGAEDLSRHSWSLLAKNPGLSKLRSLRLHNAPASQWMRAAPAMGLVTSLTLENCGLRAEDLKALARSPLWARLESLSVLLSPLGAEGAAVFSERPPPRLRALDLSWSRLGAAGLRALARAKVEFDILKLRHNGLAGSALEPLVDAECAAGLRWLDVRGNVVDVKTVERLRQRFARLLI